MKECVCLRAGLEPGPGGRRGRGGASSPQVQSVLSLEGPTGFVRCRFIPGAQLLCGGSPSPAGRPRPQTRVGVRARHAVGCVPMCAGGELLTTLSHQGRCTENGDVGSHPHTAVPGWAYGGLRHGEKLPPAL